MNAKIALISTFILISTSSAVLAAGSSTTTTTKASSNWSLNLSNSFNSSLHSSSDEDHAFDTDIAIQPVYSLSNGAILTAYISGNKDLKGERLFSWNDVVLGISKTMVKQGDFSMSGKISSYIPLSESSKDDRKLQTGFAIGPSFSYGFADQGMENLSMLYSPSIRLNFYEFETSLKGRSNTQYSLRNTLGFSYSMTESLDFSLTGRYARNFTYNGNQKDSYELSQELGMTLTPETSLAIGHITGGSPLAPNGENTDIDIFDSRESTIYISFGLSL